MQKLSRRQIASYAADLMAAGKTKELVPRLAASLIANNKTSQLDQLMSDIAYELEDRKLAATVKVTSAESLSMELKAQIEKFIASKTDVKDVVLDPIIDDSVVGGVHLETSKYGWDQTIKRRLTDIREAF